MILTSNISRAKRYNNIGVSLQNTPLFKSSLFKNYHTDRGQLELSKSQTELLVQSVSLRNIRSTVALKIYIKTQSVKAVAEALGHKEVNITLLESYLPSPLMEFYNNRWIRTFQNAVIFEALKDSELLVDALDFTQEKLNEFIKNHSLHDLPDYIAKTKNCILDEDSQQEISQIEQLVFIISTPLLQLLIAITSMVDNASEHERFIPWIEKWYEAAMFILNHFTITNDAVTKVSNTTLDMQHLFETAVKNPLNINQLKEQFLCP